MFPYSEWDAVKTYHTKNMFSCQVTGRSYEFDKSVFPTSVKVAARKCYIPLSS